MVLPEERNVEWEYLKWLGEMAGETSTINPGRSYSLLLEQMYRKEFQWSVRNDDNRAEDALYLREAFSNKYGGLPIFGNASLLEVMVALSERLAFEMSEECDLPYYWFRNMLDNSGLLLYSDEFYMNDYSTPSVVDSILNRIIFREYDYDGSGGLFPLKEAKEDQRGVELWYQMAAYVIERSGY